MKPRLPSIVERTEEREMITVRIANTAGSIQAPRSIVQILRRTLAHVRSGYDSVASETAIDVRSDEGVWRIAGYNDRHRKVLSSSTALPRVAGAAVASLIGEIAQAAGLDAFRAAVVERDGFAVAFVGDDWESAVVLSAHLHVTGWRLLGADYALVDPISARAFAVKKTYFFPLSVVDRLPASYRPCVEQSPWFTTQRTIAFYSVDPVHANRGPVWADSGRLCAVLKIDGFIATAPLIEHTAPFALTENLNAETLVRAGVAFGVFCVGDHAASRHVFQSWFDSVVANVPFTAQQGELYTS